MADIATASETGLAHAQPRQNQRFRWWRWLLAAWCLAFFGTIVWWALPYRDAPQAIGELHRWTVLIVIPIARVTGLLGIRAIH